MKKRVLSLSVLFFLLLSLSAFAAKPVEISIKNHKFQPSEVSIPANTRVKLIVKNLDSTPEEFESHSMHLEKIIPGGKQAVMWVGPLKPGTYKFIGEFNPKTAKGKVIVK